MAKTEAEIEKKMTTGVKDLGGLCLKWVSPGNAGVPDRIVIIRGAVFFVELKTETGHLSALQKNMIRKLIRQGMAVIVLYGEKDVDNFLDTLKRLIHKYEVQGARVSEEMLS